MCYDVYSSLTVVDTIFNASEATIDGHLTLNQNIRVGAVPTTCTNLWWSSRSTQDRAKFKRRAAGYGNQSETKAVNVWLESIPRPPIYGVKATIDGQPAFNRTIRVGALPTGSTNLMGNWPHKWLPTGTIGKTQRRRGEHSTNFCYLTKLVKKVCIGSLLILFPWR